MRNASKQWQLNMSVIGLDNSSYLPCENTTAIFEQQGINVISQPTNRGNLS